MKELACLFLVTVTTLASGSPHGYGVKGGAGAGARAEATAVAGAGAFDLGGSLPLSGPGGAISGSFSKSSASSFAASSASSSSYSFNGAGGLNGALGSNPGLVPYGSGKTDTGSNRNDGTKGEAPGNYAAFGGAQAAAAAGAFAFAPSFGSNEVPCDGDCQNKQPASCEGARCSPNSGSSKCTSGQCGSSGTSASQYDSTDIQVNVDSTRPKKPYDDNKINKPKPHGDQKENQPCSSGNCGAPNARPTSDSYTPSYAPNPSNYDSPGQPSCAFGNCAGPAKPNGGSYQQPSYPNNPSTNNQPICNSPNCAGSNPQDLYPTAPVYPSNGNGAKYPEPSKLLTTPKESSPQAPKCSTPDCGSSDSYSPDLPSSYNVPLNPGKPNLPCSSGDCYNNAPHYPNVGNPKPSYNPSSPNKGAPGKPCSSPSCGGQPDFGVPSYPEKNSPSHYGDKPIPSCSNGNCGKHPHSPSPSPVAPGNTFQNPSPNHQYPAKPIVGSPACSSGNCASNTPTLQPVPQYPGPFNRPSTISSSPGNCASGNCGPSPHLNPNDPDPDSFVALRPVENTNPTKSPAYHGSFGGPSGILKPNEYSAPVKPFVPATNPSPSYATPVAPSNTHKTPGGGYTPEANVHPTHSLPHYSGSGSQSSAAAVAGASSFAYTGGFGGPPGYLKPYDNGKGNGPAGGEGKYSVTPNSVSNGNTGSGNYGGHYGGSGSSAGAFAGAGSFGGSYGHQGGHDSQGKDYNGGGGCEGGCGGHGGHGGHGGSLGVGGGVGGFGLGLAKTGLDVLAGGIHGAVSAAKSVAGAVSGAGSGAGSFGVSGSFASSAASAGSATKGGYGR